MLAITLGDPAGTTIEILAALLAEEGRWFKPPGEGVGVICGSRWHWNHQHELMLSRGNGVVPQKNMRVIRSLEEGACLGSGWYFLDIDSQAAGMAGLRLESLQRPALELTPRERGALSVAALNNVPPASPCRSLAVVTGPIDKAACHEVGFAHPGQTEFFEELWGQMGIMVLAGPRLKVGLVTNHLPLSEVSKAITGKLVAKKIKLLSSTLQRSYGIVDPKIAVCALNPHAGDGGLFGTEDLEIIAPALRDSGAVGPIPADSVFHFAMKGEFDGVLAMYHDQGLGPLKTVHFDDAVNVTGGLPHLRVSPDHGPGRNLFMKGTASGKSWEASLDLAASHLRGAAGARSFP